MSSYCLSYEKNRWQQLLPMGRHVVKLLFLMFSLLTTNETRNLLAVYVSDIGKLSSDHGDEYKVIHMPPTETKFAQSNQDSVSSVAGAKG